MTIGIRIFNNKREVLKDLNYEQREVILKLPRSSIIVNGKKVYSLLTHYYDTKTNTVSIAVNEVA